MSLIANAELLQVGIDYINNRTAGQVISFTKAVYFNEDSVTNVVSDIQETAVKHAITGDNSVTLKSELVQLLEDRTVRYVTYYIDNLPFVKCKLTASNTVYKKYTNSTGLRLTHQLRFEFPNMFSIFTFPVASLAYATAPYILKKDMVFPWLEKHSVLSVSDMIEDQLVTAMVVGHDYWVCPVSVNFAGSSYNKDIITLSGGQSGDKYNKDIITPSGQPEDNSGIDTIIIQDNELVDHWYLMNTRDI